MAVREVVLGTELAEKGVLDLWNSCVPSSPSVRIIRQCLRMAASLLNSAASSFRKHGKTLLSLDPRELISNENSKQVIATSPKANIMFFFHQEK